MDGVLLSSVVMDAPWPEAEVCVQVGAPGTPTWQVRDDLRVLDAQINSGATGRQRATLRRLYGTLRLPGTVGSLSAVDPVMMGGWWTQIALAPRVPPENLGGPEEVEELVIWRGVIAKPQDQPSSTATTSPPRGDQVLVAYGPDRLLEQRRFSWSKWLLSGYDTLVPLDRLDGFNRRTAAGAVRGNRSATTVQGVYGFGGRDVWTARQMVEHLLTAYIQDFNAYGNPDWPVWSLSGQVEALEHIQPVVEFREPVDDAWRVLCAILHPRWGVDFILLPTSTGFTIRVFTAVPEAVDAGDYTLPANLERYTVDFAGAPDVRAEIEEGREQYYDGVIVRGAPIVVCCSGGSGAQMAAAAGWLAADETAYKAAAGTDPVANDAYRQTDRFRDVFQRFVLVPGDWQSGYASPGIWADGELLAGTVPRQDIIRRTLDWLPLLAGYDYTTDPPTWAGTAGEYPEFLPPKAVVTDPITGRRVDVEALQAVGQLPAEVHPLQNEWGLRLTSNPRHAFARAHFTAAAASQFDPDGSAAPSGSDYETLGFTLALELDYAVQLECQLPAAEQAGLGNYQVIPVPDAQLWLLAPQTIVGIAAAGTDLVSPASVVVLRDDRDLLKRLLAGAVARYLQTRKRAVVRYVGLHPAHTCLGAILEAVQLGGVPRQVNAPLTSIQWDFEARTTTLRTGQAV